MWGYLRQRLADVKILVDCAVACLKSLDLDSGFCLFKCSECGLHCQPSFDLMFALVGMLGFTHLVFLIFWYIRESQKKTPDVIDPS